MSKNSGKYLSPGQLKSRGWTNALIAELLPRPRYWHSNGRSMARWLRDDVIQAELTAAFKERANGETLSGKALFQAKAHTEALTELLQKSWEQTEKGEDAAWTLAGYYHAAVTEHLPAAHSRKYSRLNQVTGNVNNFLALEHRCDSRQLPAVLTNLVRSGPWLGQNPGSLLTTQLAAHWAELLHAAAEKAIADFSEAQPEAKVEDFLSKEGFPTAMLLQETLGTVYSVWYVPQAIRTSLEVLVALNPKDEYPEARAMRRHFILHVGGTNTGKTYAGFQRLRHAPTGVYLAPLRLLALEAQETLLDYGVDCSLTTGEEEDRREEDTHIAATAEKLDLKRRYDVAVIDECQMIADPERGYAWTRALLGVLAPEIHLCTAPEAQLLLTRLIESCGDTYEIETHRRRVPLIPMSKPVDFANVQPGDALITFSKVGVLSIAEDLRQNGKEPAIIYGALPYATRRKQMEGFLSGRMQYVVSTDAIGMGLNLPIRRIIFMDTEKFDGKERRPLKPEEIQQIAGRAGRYGMYDKGYVGATEDLAAIRGGLRAFVPPLQKAVVGFSDLVLQVDFDLLQVLTEWNRMPTAEPYVKLDISRYITLISKMREMGFLFSKEQELKAANIPFDETEEPLRELFIHFLRLYVQGEELEQPELAEGETPTLPELELQCRRLDLYFSFCKAFSVEVDEDKLYTAREKLADEINEILLHRLKNNIRFCASCGKALPLHHHGRLCDACFRRINRVKFGRK